MTIFNQNNYQTKQVIAGKIENYAAVRRSDKMGHFTEVYEGLNRFIDSISHLPCFAAQVAQTVSRSMSPYSHHVAAVSGKQAWIIACAAVENGIELNFNKKTYYSLWLRTKQSACALADASERCARRRVSPRYI